MGRPDETVRLARTALRLDPGIFGPRAVLLAGLWRQGQADAARKVLVDIQQRAAAGKGEWYEVAEGLALFGDRAGALDALERSLAAREAFIGYGVGCDPMLETLHGEPRFHAVLTKMGIGPCVRAPGGKTLLARYRQGPGADTPHLGVPPAIGARAS